MFRKKRFNDTCSSSLFKTLTASLCVKKFVFDLPVCVVRVDDGLPRENGKKLRVNMLTSAKIEK